MAQRVTLFTILALALAGCALGESAHATALRRWQAQPIRHYVLRTYEVTGGLLCAQTVEVRDEVLVQIGSDTCQHPSWTVQGLFSYAASAQLDSARCARLVPGAGCVCRGITEVEAAYDPLLGYPSEITTRQIWQAAWQSQSYWAYVAQHGLLPDCTQPFSDPGRRIVVREIQAIP